MTDRQKELITNLLITYEFYAHQIHDENEYVKFQFNNNVYNIYESDYKVVCEIIDYIKGVKS